ncbi:MAG: 4a-hydroxytetrahydrobiopterin dehydratase [Nitrososphaerota archaeon]|jgi:4a-hydroxytetrahydrobiopterin dehydratase|nr:4a-hydroxytetrahydrobiopterin dehydratase [Nitrososphaerota archaeon]
MSTEDYQKLSKRDVARSLVGLKRWKIIHGKLHREYRFGSFEDAVAFIVKSSLEVVKLDHHPEWFNVYDRVVVDLVTHDVGGVSNYDFILARKLEAIASEFRAK